MGQAVGESIRMRGPSKRAESWIARLLPAEYREEVLGDLYERYRSPAQYLLDVVCLLPWICFCHARSLTKWVAQFAERNRTEKGRAMSIRMRLTIAFAVIGIICAGLWLATRSDGSAELLSYSQFEQAIALHQLDRVIILDSRAGAALAQYRLPGGKTARTVLPSNYSDALSALRSSAISVEIRDAAIPSRVLWNSVPFLLLLTVWLILMAVRPNFRNRSGLTH